MLRVVHPKLVYTPGLETLLQSVHDAVTWFDLLYLGERYDKGALYIMALLRGLGQDERMAALTRLSVPDKPKGKILRGLEAADSVMHRLQPSDPWNVSPADRPGYRIDAVCACAGSRGRA